MQDEDQFIVNNNPIINGTDARPLTRQIKAEAVEIRIDSVFKILDVASGKIKGGFKVQIEDVKSKEKLQISIPADTLTSEQKAKLQDGEWNKKPMSMQINASKMRGKITKAVLIEAGIN
jgi:hypothetical protein